MIRPDECAECGRRLFSDATYVQTHTDEYHQGVREGLYGALRRLLDQEARNRLQVAQAGAQGLVGIRTRSRVYRGLHIWHTVSREFWEELGEPGGSLMRMNREWLLRYLRSSASDMARWKYGIDVNPATWAQKIYDQGESHDRTRAVEHL